MTQDAFHHSSIVLSQGSRLRTRTSRTLYLWKCCWSKSVTRRGRCVASRCCWCECFSWCFFTPLTPLECLASHPGCELSSKADPDGEEASSSEPRHQRRVPDQVRLLPHSAGTQQRVWTQQLSHGQVLLAALQSDKDRIPPNADEWPD